MPTATLQAPALSAAALGVSASEKGLVFRPSLLEHAVAALDAGKHVMLTGVAGTGKTSLAFLLGEMGHHALLNCGYVAVTASPDWTIADTIGRYEHTPEGMAFQPGVALQTIQSGAWLVIDEMNRANFDSSFGPLFTALAGQPVTLPFRQKDHSHPLSLVPPHGVAPRDTEPIYIPPSWRIIATMNQFDKDTLFRMSYGLMRRFAFIEVASLTDAEIRALVAGPGEQVAALLCVRDFVDLGPALYVDAARFMARRDQDGAAPSRILFEAFYSYFLPQLGAITPGEAKKLVAALTPHLHATEARELGRCLYEMTASTAARHK